MRRRGLTLDTLPRPIVLGRTEVFPQVMNLQTWLFPLTPSLPKCTIRPMATDTIDNGTLLLERARALGPVVEQYRDQGEAERHMPRPLFDAMYAAGLYQMMLSPELGGSHLSLVE